MLYIESRRAIPTDLATLTSPTVRGARDEFGFGNANDKHILVRAETHQIQNMSKVKNPSKMMTISRKEMFGIQSILLGGQRMNDEHKRLSESLKKRWNLAPSVQEALDDHTIERLQADTSIPFVTENKQEENDDNA